jgi:hypothetical protein
LARIVTAVGDMAETEVLAVLLVELPPQPDKMIEHSPIPLNALIENPDRLKFKIVPCRLFSRMKYPPLDCHYINITQGVYRLTT